MGFGYWLSAKAPGVATWQASFHDLILAQKLTGVVALHHLQSIGSLKNFHAGDLAPGFGQKETAAGSAAVVSVGL
jgi:hypothetical protein